MPKTDLAEALVALCTTPHTDRSVEVELNVLTAAPSDVADTAISNLVAMGAEGDPIAGEAICRLVEDYGYTLTRRA